MRPASEYDPEDQVADEGEDQESSDSDEAKYDLIENLLKYEKELVLAFHHFPLTIKHGDIEFLGFYSFEWLGENTWTVSKLRFKENESKPRYEPHGEWSQNLLKDLLSKYLWVSPKQDNDPACVLVKWNSETKEFIRRDPKKLYIDDYEDRSESSSEQNWIEFCEEDISYYKDNNMTLYLEFPEPRAFGRGNESKFWAFKWVLKDESGLKRETGEWIVFKLDEWRGLMQNPVDVQTDDEIVQLSRGICYVVAWNSETRAYERWVDEGTDDEPEEP